MIYFSALHVHMQSAAVYRPFQEFIRTGAGAGINQISLCLRDTAPGNQSGCQSFRLYAPDDRNRSQVLRRNGLILRKRLTRFRVSRRIDPCIRRVFTFGSIPVIGVRHPAVDQPGHDADTRRRLGGEKQKPRGQQRQQPEKNRGFLHSHSSEEIPLKEKRISISFVLSSLYSGCTRAPHVSSPPTPICTPTRT